MCFIDVLGSKNVLIICSNVPVVRSTVVLHIFWVFSAFVATDLHFAIELNNTMKMIHTMTPKLVSQAAMLLMKTIVDSAIALY